MAGEQIINEIADDRVWFISKLCDHATNQRSAATVPFEVDCAVQISRAMDLGPAMRTARLFCPHFDEVEFLLQQRIAHDLGTERSLSGSNDLKQRLQVSSGSAALLILQIS